MSSIGQGLFKNEEVLTEKPKKRLKKKSLVYLGKHQRAIDEREKRREHGLNVAFLKNVLPLGEIQLTKFDILSKSIFYIARLQHLLTEDC